MSPLRNPVKNWRRLVVRRSPSSSRGSGDCWAPARRSVTAGVCVARRSVVPESFADAPIANVGVRAGRFLAFSVVSDAVATAVVRNVNAIGMPVIPSVIAGVCASVRTRLAGARRLVVLFCHPGRRLCRHAQNLRPYACFKQKRS